MRKLLGLVVVLLAIFGLTGCQKSNKLIEIDVDEIFSMEGSYFVYFYRDDCPDCETTTPMVINYNELVKNDKKNEGKRLVYAINLSKPENEKIFRAYNKDILKWGDGQGLNGQFWVSGAESVNELYIAATSSLISVGTTSDQRRVANFQAEGYDDIYERLISHLG